MAASRARPNSRKRRSSTFLWTMAGAPATDRLADAVTTTLTHISRAASTIIWAAASPAIPSITLARPAFREDALRQCAARELSSRVSARTGICLVPAPNRGDDRLRPARDADADRRLRRELRCRFRRRGGQVLCLEAERDRRRSSARKKPILFARTYDVSAHGNWEGHNILNRLKTPALHDAETEKRPRRGRAGCSSHSAASAFRPASTTRCWPTGTAS